MIQLMRGDCLEVMREIPNGSVDMVLADPPYGTTACKWDTVIDLSLMWEQLKRVIKPNGAIVMTACQPFTSALVMSNPRMFKYCWVWNKKQGGNPLNAKRQPLRVTEDIVVFNSGGYIPQMRTGRMRKKGGINKQPETTGAVNLDYVSYSDQYYPTNILDFPNCANKKYLVHPTQKPVALMEYLIRTYTNEGETVLDFTCGSGTTGVACVNTARDFIGIELDQGYFDIAQQRIAEATKQEKDHD